MRNGSANTTCEHELAEQCDQQLAHRVADRDEQALLEVIRRHIGPVTAVCRRICHDSSEANSVVSEVFWEFWCRAHTFEETKGNVRAFLLLIARSRSIDKRRAELSRKRAVSQFRARAGDSEHMATIQPHTRPLIEERDSAVRQALHELPECQRAAIELAFFEGCTHEEVAMQLNEPLGTVKTRIRTGLLRMRNTLTSGLMRELR